MPGGRRANSGLVTPCGRLAARTHPVWVSKNSLGSSELICTQKGRDGTIPCITTAPHGELGPKTQAGCCAPGLRAPRQQCPRRAARGLGWERSSWERRLIRVPAPSLALI